MEETLRDRIFHILKMTKDDPLLAADRVIAAMFEHLENVTDEMAKAGAHEVTIASFDYEDAGHCFRAMLAAARKEAEK